MRVVVLGAGVVGTASAWYLARAGHAVTVIDRQGAAGLETSLANGGQISVSHAEPWANPSAPGKILHWLGREDAPLLFRMRADARQWAWGLRFLVECLPWRTRANTREILALALYSRTELQRLRAETGIRYEHEARGILHFHTDQHDFERAARRAKSLLEYGRRPGLVISWASVMLVWVILIKLLRSLNRRWS
jgi:D-amino-acid dehydrogenase